MSLETYNKRRNFSVTAEPTGSTSVSDVTGMQRFVVQEHHASHLHYDFRIEFDGVLKSWAVPKGPPEDFTTKRLAVQVEDHPVDYIGFHGAIPEGEYGAGTVEIWDSGVYENAAKHGIGQGLIDGKVEVILHGTRLIGKFDLIRIKDSETEWLMIRSKHAITGSSPDHKTASEPIIASAPHAPHSPIPKAETFSPMLAVAADKPFSDPDWQFEMKWDGYRAVAFYTESVELLLYSRNHQKLNDAFPEITSLGNFIKAKNAVIDGEIVSIGPDGHPHFQDLQGRMGGSKSVRKKAALTPGAQIIFMAFDLIYCDGQDLTSEPLSTRRQILQDRILDGGPLRFSASVTGEGKALYEKISALELEGIVAKKLDSKYVQARSSQWLKIKTRQTLDVVIGGYTESSAAQRPFASLVIGEYQNQQIMPVGNVGTGFNDKTMREIMNQLIPIKSAKSPFNHPPHLNGKAHWVKPALVCEVAYSQMTADHQLRHPVFIRMRPDKQPDEASVIPLAPEKELKTALARNNSAGDASLTVNRKNLHLTNLNKVFWPIDGTTKRDLLRYYSEIAPILLPYIKDRPIVLQRYPDGVEGQSFFQHDIGDHAPKWLKTYDIDEHNGRVRYALINDIASLLYAINFGSIPLHAWNVTTAHPELPDMIVFDLDPGTKFENAIITARQVHKILTELKLQCWIKTSGMSGLHICVPIKPNQSSDVVVDFARMVGKWVNLQLPKIVTVERRIKYRGAAMVYLDCLQNGVGKTVVAAYTVRAGEWATVSTPLDWNEIVSDLDTSLFTMEAVLKRVTQKGDLFHETIACNQDIDAAIPKLNNLLVKKEAK